MTKEAVKGEADGPRYKDFNLVWYQLIWLEKQSIAMLIWLFALMYSINICKKKKKVWPDKTAPNVVSVC